MKFLVRYIIFYPDNHQGASGKHFEHATLIEVDGEEKVADIKILIHKELSSIAKKSTNEWNDWTYSIQSIEAY